MKKFDYDTEITSNSDEFELSQKDYSNMQLFGNSRLRKISDILKECAQGQRILKVYVREKELTEKHRNKICDMIITDLENRHERYKFLFCFYVKYLTFMNIIAYKIVYYYVPLD